MGTSVVNPVSSKSIDATLTGQGTQTQTQTRTDLVPDIADWNDGEKSSFLDKLNKNFDQGTAGAWSAADSKVVSTLLKQVFPGISDKQLQALVDEAEASGIAVSGIASSAALQSAFKTAADAAAQDVQKSHDLPLFGSFYWQWVEGKQAEQEKEVFEFLAGRTDITAAERAQLSKLTDGELTLALLGFYTSSLQTAALRLQEKIAQQSASVDKVVKAQGDTADLKNAAFTVSDKTDVPISNATAYKTDDGKAKIDKMIADLNAKFDAVGLDSTLRLSTSSTLGDIAAIQTKLQQQADSFSDLNTADLTSLNVIQANQSSMYNLMSSLAAKYTSTAANIIANIRS